ncbi:MAG TPA: hypothetical protein VHD36_04900 [Pirellulales bacterium]|nr:hypothetical protein [Pirellulales bacterium]
MVQADEAAEPAADATVAVGTFTDSAIDWDVVFLAEFAGGGPAENQYRLGRSADDSDDAIVGHGANGRDCDEKLAVPLAKNALFTATDARGDDDAAEVPLSTAAREILKLRRAVGINPIAGTMFDAAGDEASATDAPDSDDVDERYIAAAVHRLEEDEAAAQQTYAEAQHRPVAYRPGAEYLLRPAERHLEEAAALLEQAGQYERADMAREMAARIRQDARRFETYGAPVEVSPAVPYGPANR